MNTALEKGIAIKGKNHEESQTPKQIETAIVSRLNNTFTVFANKVWQDAGIIVNVGNVITIQHISGSWTTFKGYHPYVDADGNIELNDPKNTNHPLPSAYPGVLIAKIGYSSPQEIGKGATFQAGLSGALYLQMNDDMMSDNDGSIVVQITVKP